MAILVRSGKMQVNTIKRHSPIFWILIALVLFINVPVLMTLLGAFFSYTFSVTTGYFANDLTPLPAESGFSYGTTFLLILMSVLTGLASVAAMLSLIFRKYKFALKLLIFTPVCLFVVILMLIDIFNLADGTDEFILVVKPMVIAGVNYVVIAGILFLYAKKYHRLENLAVAA